MELKNILLDENALAPIAADILEAQRKDKGGKRETAPDKNFVKHQLPSCQIYRNKLIFAF